MGDLTSEDATRVSDHHPTVLRGGGNSWVVCRCGWQSRMMPTGQRAGHEWALHLAFMLCELDPEWVDTVDLDATERP